MWLRKSCELQPMLVIVTDCPPQHSTRPHSYPLILSHSTHSLTHVLHSSEGTSSVPTSFISHTMYSACLHHALHSLSTFHLAPRPLRATPTHRLLYEWLCQLCVGPVRRAACSPLRRQGGGSQGDLEVHQGPQPEGLCGIGAEDKAEISHTFLNGQC